MAAHEAAMEEPKGDDIFHPEDVYEFFKDVWAKTRQAEEEKLQEEAAWEPEKASETVVVEQEDAPESSKKPRTTANQKALKFRSSQKGGGCITICKYKGQKRVPSGKTVREKGKDPAARREELLRKSRGPSDAGSNKHYEAENADPWGAFLRANGAFSVPALQPIDEGYRPLVGLSVKDRYRSRSSDSPSLDRSSPPNKLSDVSNGIVSRDMVSVAHSEEERNRGVTSTEERSASQETDHTIDLGSGFADDDSETWEGEDDEEWVEVGLDDDEADEDGQVEEAEYWEGDLPPLTPEEEEELLREAERELAELESLGDAGKDADLDLETSESSADLAISQQERKLAKLKNLVQQMEETLAKEKRHTPKSKASNALEGDSLGGNNGEAIGSELAADGEDNGYEEERDEEGEEDGEDIQNVVQKKSKMFPVNGQQPDLVRIESKRLSLTERRQSLYYWDADDEVEDEDEQAKERKGVPAVMRCFDKAKVFVKAGDGGNGEVAFRREKFVPFGGPSGGNGGRGGNVYVEVDSEMNSLLPFRKTVHFRAGRGSHGGGKGREGATGTDCTMAVPPGTVIREDGPEGKVLMELVKSGQREMLLPGGLGGRGNAAFKTGRNNAPQLAENGEAGAEMWLQLELKLVADVGIIGVPNAGKSTLLSVISAAKPEIANYPFTTLLPNLGVVALDYDATMVVADLPGLLEGAHTGTGLGHEFLRHTERCRVLVHVVDGMSLQPLEEFEAVRLELQLFNPILSTKPFVVAFNKMDVPEAAERWQGFQEGLRCKGIQPFCMSAATQEGTSAVVSAAYALWKQQQERALRENKAEEETKAVAVAAMVRKQRSSPIEDFQIDADMHTRTWQVTGAGLERFTQMTNWEYFESVRRFQRVLDASGVNQALRKKGVREGDTVIVSQMEFTWMESDKMSALKDWKRAGRGSRHWPH